MDTTSLCCTVGGGRTHCAFSILDKAKPFLVIFTGAISDFEVLRVYGNGGRIRHRWFTNLS